MLDTEKKLISMLTADATLTALLPANNITFGPIDITTEIQSEIRMPLINIHLVSEGERSIPQGARDTSYQIDIWSRISQIEVENIYERVMSVLSFQSYDQGTSHTFWQRSSSASDIYEGEMRLWHRQITLTVWAMPT